MDRRIFILPIASALLLLVLLARPDITGLMVGTSSASSGKNISANITVIIPADGFVPDGSYVLVYLDDRESTMDIGDFIKGTGTSYNHEMGKIQSIGYEGYGYSGDHTYALDISAFNIGMIVESGEHSLTVAVVYEKNIITRSSQIIVVR